MEITNGFADRMINCLGNFVWLRNNLHNFNTPEFKEMLKESMNEAKQVYDLLERSIHG